MTELPSLRDELNRKALNAIEWLTNAHTAGDLADSQFSTGIDAVFMTAAGLVDPDIMEMFSLAGQADNRPAVDKRSFINGSSVITLIWHVGLDNFQVRARAAGLDSHNVIKQFAAPASARSGMRAVANRLIESGYSEL